MPCEMLWSSTFFNLFSLSVCVCQSLWVSVCLCKNQGGAALSKNIISWGMSPSSGGKTLVCVGVQKIMFGNVLWIEVPHIRATKRTLSYKRSQKRQIQCID